MLAIKNDDNGAHAVLIIGIDHNSITIHDPGYYDGSTTIISFELLNDMLFRDDNALNGFVIWASRINLEHNPLDI